MHQKFKVELTATAEAAYRRIYAEASPHLENDTSHPKVKLLRIIDECIDTLIPHDPFALDRALAGSLSNIYRVSKGRMRICYVASTKHGRIIILYISETPRKDGDRHDPYVLFTSRVMSGQFDHVFDLLGVRRPARKVAMQAPQVH